MALDVARLRVLVEVAHAGSIAAAARRMTFTPSALSQQIAKLEAELACRLLDRGPTGVRLTEMGQVLVEHGERVLGELRDAEAAVSAVTASRHLALGTFATAGAALVPPALGALRRDHPELRLRVLDLEPPAGYGLVASGDLDLLITHRYPGMPSTPTRGLVRQDLLLDPLRLAEPGSATTEPGSAGVRLVELADRTWVSGGAGVPNRVCLEHLGRHAGFTPRVEYETADYTLTLALVGVGLGVSLVPASVLSTTQPPGVVSRRLADVEPAREICIVHRRRPSPLLTQLITLIGRTAAEVRDASG